MSNDLDHKNPPDHDEPEKEYDFSKGKQGVYARRFAEDSNLVAIQPELMKYFPDSESVNHALRLLVDAAGKATTLRSK